MALGTSPRPCWTLSGAMTACIYLARTTARGLAARAPKVRLDTPWLARMFAGLHLGGLGILLMTAWHGTEAAGATIAGLAGAAPGLPDGDRRRGGGLDPDGAQRRPCFGRLRHPIADVGERLRMACVT